MKRQSLFLAVTLVAALVLLLVAGYAASAREGSLAARVVPYGAAQVLADEIIVKLKPGAPAAAIDALNRAHGAAVVSRSPYAGFLRLRLRAGESIGQAVAAYRGNPQVQYAEPNLVRRALMTPNDPYYPYQWHLHAGTGINIEPAWDISTGSGVVVAVIDTGIAYEDYTERVGHVRKSYYQAPDLAGATFVAGYDFINSDAHPNDDNSHGTHVAGTIAQSTNNSLGVAGVAFGASLMPVKVLDADGYGSDAGVADGIYFAANNGAQVINMSLGGAGTSTTLGDAVAYAYSKGVTIVAAAGNEAEEGNPPSYPAAYDDYVIAVAATRYDQTRAYYSNYGSYVDIAAPGGDTTVDQDGDGYPDGVLQNTFNPTTQKTSEFGYWFFQGTSMATPHVAGVAALAIANGLTTPDEVRAAIQTTAEDKGAAGWDPYYGWGLVDAYAAVSYTPAPVHDVAVTGVTAPSTAVQGDSVTVSVTAGIPGDFAESFDVTLTDTTAGVVIGTQTVTALAAGGSQTLSFTWDTTSAAAGSHELQAAAAAVSGEAVLSNNAKTAAVSVVPAGQVMHVAGIGMSLRISGRNTAGVARVTICDAAGNPVAGASVSGHWSGAAIDRDTGITDAAGLATVQSNNVKRPASGAAYTFTVDSVSLAGWAYDAAANVETSDSITVP